MPNPFLSIVFPAHNEEQRLPETLGQVKAFLGRQSYSSEVLVVENGSTDRTLELAREYSARMPGLRVLHEEARGKGLAVKRGMLEARGEYRFFADVDLSMPIEEVNRFLPVQLEGVDIAIASREAAGAVRYNEPPFRHFTGRIFNTLVRRIALPGLQDTQCGFKCFHARAVEDIFPFQTITGWTFDVELLYIAFKRGYRIQEVPIPWYYNPGSKVRVMKDSLRMAKDLFNIRSNDRLGLYDRSPSNNP